MNELREYLKSAVTYRRYSDDNYYTGRFELLLEEDYGVFILYIFDEVYGDKEFVAVIETINDLIYYTELHGVKWLDDYVL